VSKFQSAKIGVEASFKRGKGEAGMDEYQVRTWQGWHHHMALSLIAVWFLIGETHRGKQWTPALTLPQVRYGLSVLLLEVFCTPGVDDICRQVQRQLLHIPSDFVVKLRSLHDPLEIVQVFPHGGSSGSSPLNRLSLPKTLVVAPH
jgi:hypothetical protein